MKPTPRERDSERIGLPPRIFFYTPEQISMMLEVSVETVKRSILFYEGREPGICPKSKMRAYNVMPEGEIPQWRVTERSFLGYLKNKGIRYYTRGYTS